MRNHIFPKLIIFSLTVTLLACLEQTSKNPSKTNGLGQIAALRLPKLKNAAEMRRFKSSIHGASAGRISRSGVQKSQMRTVFRSVVMDSLLEVDGMPRQQLSFALTNVLRDKGACGGINCAQVFNVNDQEVPTFIDESATLIKNDPLLNKPEHLKTKAILLTSFEKPQDLWKPGSKGEPIFADKDTAQQVLLGIIEENMPKLARMIRDQRYEINVNRSDEELFLTKNCGPASIALQKILADRGIFAEARVNSRDTMDHEYLLYRALLEDGKSVEFIIDPTYRQFLFTYTNRQLFKNFTGGTIDDAAVFKKIKGYDLDKVLIVEYEKLDAYLGSLRGKLPDFDYLYEIRFAYEKGPLNPAMQKEHPEFLTQEQLTRLRRGRPTP